MRRHCIVALLLTAALAPSLARAAGFELTDQSVIAAGSGGAGTARQSDPAAAWYNPAAQADDAGFRASAALILAIPRLSARSTQDSLAPADQPTNNELGVATPFALNLGYARGRWAVGLYAGTSHGTTVSWPAGWWGRFDIVSSSLRVVRTAPSAAVRFGRLRLGVGVHVDFATMELVRALDFVDAEGSSHLRLSGASAGADASIYVEVLPTLDVGLTYQSRTAIQLRGDADFTVPDSFAAHAPDQHVSSSLTLPDRFALGLAHHRGRVSFFADVTVTLWSVRDTLTLDFENPNTPDVVEPQRWRESFSVHGGIEAAVSERVRLRGGAYYDHQAAPSETLAASGPDMSRVGLSIGGSVQLHRTLAADLSYSLAFFVPRDGTGPDAIPASYSGQVHMIGVAFRAANPPR
ncbi:MAG: Long-chain fatty acid transport protein [Myxococcales bacterium]|nr:Long-chain fatty acid transport protein [Myxococcales bacterium]